MTPEPPEPVQLVSLEETYPQDHLKLVDAVRPGVDLGWKRVTTTADPRLWRYADRVESKLDPEHRPLEVERVTALQSTVTAPVAGMPNKSDKWAKRTGKVLDQALTPHCVTFSGSSYRVHQERKEHRRTYTPNADDWYHRTKLIDPWGPGVDGTGIPYAAEVARTDGMTMDDPRSKRDDPGRRFKIRSYVAIESIEQMLEALYRHGPVWFGIDVDRGIFRPRQTTDGHWVLPPPGEEQIVGGHAMLMVGWWLSMGWVLVQNSWGTGYANKGYVWYPIAYFSHPDYWWDAWLVDDEDDAFISHKPIAA